MTSFLVTYKENKYEIKKFLKSHPAGEEILLPFKDNDITEAFDAIGHSGSALKILTKYLVKEEKEVEGIKEKENTTKKEFVKDDNKIVRRLFTSEDKFNIHKLFGAFALFSFAYRYFYLLPLYGDLGFSGTMFDNITLISHFILSSSSLLFHVLDKRFWISELLKDR
jgi:hypothetical protein